MKVGSISECSPLAVLRRTQYQLTRVSWGVRNCISYGSLPNSTTNKPTSIIEGTLSDGTASTVYVRSHGSFVQSAILAIIVSEQEKLAPDPYVWGFPGICAS
jgi:hypothetical protein